MSDQPNLAVTPTPHPKPRDVAAAKLIDAYASNELARVRATAEKWTTGLAALITVLSTAIVIKGPESFEDLEKEAKYTVIGAISIGAAALAFGIFSAYQAAAGSPTKRSALDKLVSQQRELAGTAKVWREAVSGLIAESRTKLKHANWATLLGGTALAVAIAVAWLGPQTDAKKTNTCFTTDTGLTQIEGPLPEVTQGSIQVVPCKK